jgi:hypothetical protein
MGIAITIRHTVRPLAGVVLLGLLACAPAQAAGYIPVEGCYLGGYIELDHLSGGDLDLFEEAVGLEHASYFRYVGYGSPFPFQWVKDMHRRGILPHIAWEPNNGLDPVRDDDYLRGWMEAAGRTKGPIFLRYASEMNGTWQAYSGDPQEFIDKWRLVTRIARELAPNVIMVWCPFATPQSTIASYYPGDAWVDWVGVNIYSVHHYDGDPAKPAIDDPREHLRYVYNLYAHRKPIAVCEYAATHFCAACGNDVTEFGLKQLTRLYESLPTQFPRVKMISWFCVDAYGTGLASNNYSLTRSPEFIETYRRLTDNAYFLGRIPDASQLIAELPSTAGVAPPPETVAYGPLEIPVEPVTPQPVNEPPPTPSQLALTSIGAVGPKDLDVAVVGAPPSALAGSVEVVVEPGEELSVDCVAFYVDGQWRAITNAHPFRYPWDTNYEDPGEHEITVVGMNSASLPVAETTVSVIVAPRG